MPAAVIWLIPVALVLGVAATSGKRRNGSIPAPNGGDVQEPPAPPDGGSVEEYGQAPFPPMSISPEWDKVQHLAAVAEQEARIPGLRDFLLIKTWWESRGYPGAMNRKDGAAAFRGFCRKDNWGGRYVMNPWKPIPCESGVTHADRWHHSGGLLGLMPHVALATSDKRARIHDPARIFDPAFAIAYQTDLIVRLRKKNGARKWDSVWAGTAAPKYAKLPSSKLPGVRTNMRKATEAMSNFDVPLSLRDQVADIRKYPGFTAVLHGLMEADGRPVS